MDQNKSTLQKTKTQNKTTQTFFANRVPRKQITTICNQHFSRKQVPEIVTLFFTHNARVFLLINLGLAKFDEIGSNEFVNFEVMVLSWSGLCFSFGVSRRHLLKMSSIKVTIPFQENAWF